MNYNSAKRRMNPDIKVLWLEALKSGEYKKGKGLLRDEGDNFCCLGVLCNIHAQAHPEIAKKEMYAGSYMGSATCLPNEVVLWAGLKTRGGAYLEYAGIPLDSLENLNDRTPTFAEVIKAIERYF